MQLIWEVLVYLSGMRNLAWFLPCPSQMWYSSMCLLQARFKKEELLFSTGYKDFALGTWWTLISQTSRHFMMYKMSGLSPPSRLGKSCFCVGFSEPVLGKVNPHASWARKPLPQVVRNEDYIWLPKQTERHTGFSIGCIGMIFYSFWLHVWLSTQTSLCVIHNIILCIDSYLLWKLQGRDNSLPSYVANANNEIGFNRFPFPKSSVVSQIC